jgi:cell division protein FtsB
MGWRYGAAGAVDVQEASNAEVEALKQRIDALTAEIEELRSRNADQAK